jgi:hypothetical protein
VLERPNMSGGSHPDRVGPTDVFASGRGTPSRRAWSPEEPAAKCLRPRNSHVDAEMRRHEHQYHVVSRAHDESRVLYS